jgi:phosphatidylserine/phosphatidylglycerophosphate/cardiolipin synthase-like enzyme
VDGTIGFTGGMNIRPGNMLSTNPRHPCVDMQFRVEGPIVRQLQRVFAEDWAFCTGEVLSGDAVLPILSIDSDRDHGFEGPSANRGPQVAHTSFVAHRTVTARAHS